MKSFQVVDFNAPLKEVDQPTPQPSGTQVLIKVKAAGVCHSDLHIWEGGYDLGHDGCGLNWSETNRHSGPISVICSGSRSSKSISLSKCSPAAIIISTKASESSAPDSSRS